MNAKSPCFYGVSSLLFIAGCGGKTTASPPLTQSEFVEQYCASVAKCCGAVSLSGDPKTCAGVFSGSRGSFDQASSRDCLAQISKNEADPQWCTAYANPPTACNAALGALLGQRGAGSGKVGDPCATASDCATSAPNAYAACVAGGALSSPLKNECAVGDIVDGGQGASCSGDIVFDAVGWMISNDVGWGFIEPVCADEFAPTCTFTTPGLCVTRLSEGFTPPGAPCDLENACAYGECSADSSGTCPSHFAPDDGLKLLCAPSSP